MPILTQNDIRQAELNGIGRKTLYNRVYSLGMEVEEAITKPTVKKECAWGAFKDIAVVSRSTFYYRIADGMEPEQAATTPRKPRKGCKIFPEHIAIAEKNGIGLPTLRQRVYGYKWPIERAISEPIGNTGNRGDWSKWRRTKKSEH